MLTSACARLMAVSTSPRAWPSGLPIWLLTLRAIASLFWPNSNIHLRAAHNKAERERSEKTQRTGGGG